MQQQNQGKITIQQGQKYGTEGNWAPVIGEKEFLYFSEAEEAFDDISWQIAEEISRQQLDESKSTLGKLCYRGDSESWEFSRENVLFIGK